MKFALLISAALACVGCRASSNTQTSVKKLTVYAPLSGAEAARGEAVLRVATLINARLDAQPAAGVTIDVHDARLSDERLTEELRALAKESVVIVGGCREARAIAALFGAAAPLTIVMFCEAMSVRYEIEKNDELARRFFWIGPTTIDMFRVSEVYFRHSNDPGAEFDTGIDSGTVVYSSQETADHGRLLATIAETAHRGLKVQTIDIAPSDNLKTIDYTAEIAGLPPPQPHDNLFIKQDFHNYVAIYAPWLSCLEWIRQVQLTLDDPLLTLMRRMTFFPAEYLAQDAGHHAFPFRLDDMGALGFVGQVDLDAVHKLEDESRAAFGAGDLSMLSRLVADTMLSATLALATRPADDPVSVRDRWLHITGADKNGEARDVVTYASLGDGLALATKSPDLDYQGVYSSFDGFDRFGQLAGDVKGVIKRLQTNEEGTGTILSPEAIPREPIEGLPVDLNEAFTRGCIRFERAGDTEPWIADASPVRMFDRDKVTGIANVLTRTTALGVNIHFSQPLELTAVQWQHSNLKFTTANSAIFTHRLFWWDAALPDGFAPLSPPVTPSGSTVLANGHVGEYIGVEWSLHAPRVQTLAIVLEQRSAVKQEIFNDLELFATEASLDQFCR